MSKRPHSRFLRASRALQLACVMTLLGIGSAQAQTTLSDVPLYSASNVPANLMLALSVEFPTGTVAAYPNATNYSASATYLGYFDPVKCYKYDTSTIANVSPYPNNTDTGRFYPVNSTGPVCSGYWSGNMLNWALMTSLDEFRQALTGGNRTVDYPATTVLLRSNLNSQSNTSNDPDRHIDSSDNVAPSSVIGDSTYSAGTDAYLRVAAQGTQFVISNNSNFSNAGKTQTGGTKSKPTYSYYYATTYNAEVQVCVSTMEESNCNDNSVNTYVGSGKYPKPEGLIQQNYTKIRVGASGYLYYLGQGQANGAVRALVRDNGPYSYNGFGTRPSNPYSEWDKDNGIFNTDPDKDDATTYLATAPGGGAFTQSGAIQYLNDFGYANGYEKYDTIADLYWASLAYYMQKSLASSYFSSTASTLDDSFPYYTGVPAPAASSASPAAGAATATINDPMAYSCQSNNIVVIGDAHTHYDTQVPGSTLSSASGSGLPSIPADGTVPALSASTATNAMGNLPLVEGGPAPQNETMAKYAGAGTKLGNAVWGDQATYYIAGMAYYAHTSDLRNDVNVAPPAIPTAKTEATIGMQTVTTFAVDVLEPGTYDGTAGNNFFGPAAGSPKSGSMGPDIYWLAAKYGGFDDTDPSHKPVNELNWHTNSSTGTNLIPDNYFPGNRPDLLQSGLKQIFQKVGNTANQNAGAPSVNPTRVLTNVVASNPTTPPYYSLTYSGFPAYSTQYTPVSWAGDVSGNLYTSVAGGDLTPVSTTSAWHAQTQLDTLTLSNTGTGWDVGRRIVTWNDVTKAGVPFRTGDISGAEKATLTNGSSDASENQDLLNYLRGDPTNAGTYFRARAHILGDFVDSSPVLVQNALAPSYSETNNPGYTKFSASMVDREPVVYVGGNDGMLHAFDAEFSVPTAADLGPGSELFAYVPSMLFYGPTSTPEINGLAALTNLNGVSTELYSHHFYVDATPQVGDVDFNHTGDGSAAPATSSSTTAAWHSVLVGGLGKGGKGFYALDITSVPAAVNTTNSSTVEASEAKNVLWEVSNTTSPDFSDMGYSFGSPLIIKTRKYGWVAVLTSGYDNTDTGQDGQGWLYIVNIQTGALLQKITTGVGSKSSPDGLAQATGFTQDVSDGTVDQVYAGDLLGNVWRFDLTEGALDASGNPTGAYPAPTLLATLTDPLGNPQPITTAPRIEEGIDSTGLGTLRWVFVGTGQFLDIGDLTSTQQQTMYALRDGTGSTPSTTGLPLTRAGTYGSPLTAVTSLLDGVNIADSDPGWYYDLTQTAGGTTGGTERIVVSPDAAAGVPIITWATLTPSSDPCNLQGAVYATSFSGKSQLLNDDGSTATFVTTATATTSVQIVQLPGTTPTFALLTGQTNSTISTKKLNQSVGNKLPLRTNWREVLH